MGINISNYNIKTRIFCKIINSDMCKKKKTHKWKIYMYQTAGVGPGLFSCVGTFSGCRLDADHVHGESEPRKSL